MYEAKERQKFISDAQYLREMQHKMDSEYQACLRKQELTKEQPEKKRDQHNRQEMRQTTISSISPVRSYERPWISRLPINRQISSDEASGCEPKSSMKPLGNKSEAKFPAIDKTSVKQKQKASTCSRKPEKNGSCPKKDTLAFQKPILSRRRINQRSLIENPDSESMKKVEGRGKKTPVLQGITKNARGSDPQDGTGQKTGHTLKTKKKSQERRNLIQSSKLSIDSKSLKRDLRKGNVLTTAQQPATNPVDSTVQVTNGPSVSSESSNSNLPPIKNTPTRPREDDFYAMLCSNMENSTGENEDLKDVIPLEEELLSADFVSDLRNQSNVVSSTTACSSPGAKEINKPEIDPEKLKKLQESLLAEDSEEEGDQCRICQIAGGSITNPLLEPCGCGGSLRFVHQECLKTWLKAKIKSGAELDAVKTCELCKQSLTVDLDDFNVNDYYRNHQQSRAQDELMNSGLYLVLLLHLYEQRFAELMRLNYHQASRDRLSRQPRTEENQNSSNSSSSG